MIRKAFLGLAATAALFMGHAATAKEYVDYSPEKGIWQISAVEVDVNHVDDYLTGLRKSQTPYFDAMKAHGIIDAYKFVVRTGYVKGSPNVLIMTHYVSAAMLAPDKARDDMIDKEAEAKFSEADGKIAVAGYEKYRQFVDDAMWTEMTMAK